MKKFILDGSKIPKGCRKGYIKTKDPIDKWISIKDRLPPILKDVLIYDKKEVLFGWLESRPEETPVFCYYQGAEFSWTENVTHWMPLPNPPEGK